MDNHVKFASPLILYTTGSHFQSVFPRDHEYFIQYARDLQRKYNVHANSINQEMDISSEKEENVRKQYSPKQEVQKRKTTVRAITPSKKTKVEDGVDALSTEIAADISRREKIKKIKPKDRTESEKKEFTQLKVKIFRHQKYKDEEKKKADNDADKMRKRKLIENETGKLEELQKNKARIDAMRADNERRNLEKEKTESKNEANKKK